MENSSILRTTRLRRIHCSYSLCRHFLYQQKLENSPQWKGVANPFLGKIHSICRVSLVSDAIRQRVERLHNNRKLNHQMIEIQTRNAVIMKRRVELRMANPVRGSPKREFRRNIYPLLSASSQNQQKFSSIIPLVKAANAILTIITSPLL